MDYQGIVALAGALNCKVGQAGNEWVQVECPFAPFKHTSGKDSNPSFGIKVEEEGISGANCFSCGSAGGLMDILFELKHLGADVDFKKAREIIEKELDGAVFPTLETKPKVKKEVLFAEQWLESFPSANQIPEAKAYLTQRGLTGQEIIKYDIRADTFKKRVCFPFRDFTGNLKGMQGRAMGDNPNKYLHYTLGEEKLMNQDQWYGEEFTDEDRWLVLVEGAFDLMATRRAYPHVAASCGSNLTPSKLDRLAGFFEIVTLFDPDKPGNKARDTIWQWGKGEKIVKHAYLPNDKDPGETHPDIIANALAKHIPEDELTFSQEYEEEEDIAPF